MIFYLDNIKDTRSQVIAEHLQERHAYESIVILSCGNAYRSLASNPDIHLPIVPLATSAPYKGAKQLEDRFYSAAEIQRRFPYSFNATPGALSPELMAEIGRRLYRQLCKQGYHDEQLAVPAGSGETICSLQHELPSNTLVAYSCDAIPALRWDYTDLKSYVAQHFRHHFITDPDHVTAQIRKMANSAIYTLRRTT